MDKEARRAELMAEIAALDTQYEPSEAGVEVTACICAGSTWRTIAEVMDSYFVQGLRLDVVTCMDAASEDPTRGILKGLGGYMTTHGSSAVHTYRHIGDIPNRGELEDLLAFAKASMIAEVKTPYVWFGDADVVLLPDTLRVVLERLKADPTIGALCVRYDFKVTHCRWGAMMMRTDVAREVGFSGKDRCGGRNMALDLEKVGLKMTHAEGLQALHKKYGLMLV